MRSTYRAPKSIASLITPELAAKVDEGRIGYQMIDDGR